MKHHTDEAIDAFERRKMLSIRMVESWLRHFLVREKQRLGYCQKRQDELLMLRAKGDTPVLRMEWEHTNTKRGEHKAVIRGLGLVLDAWPGFCRKLFEAMEAKGL